jgi:hypothetical protein
MQYRVCRIHVGLCLRISWSHIYVYSQLKRLVVALKSNINSRRKLSLQSQTRTKPSQSKLCNRLQWQMFDLSSVVLTRVNRLHLITSTVQSVSRPIWTQNLQSWIWHLIKSSIDPPDNKNVLSIKKNICYLCYVSSVGVARECTGECTRECTRECIRCECTLKQNIFFKICSAACFKW